MRSEGASTAPSDASPRAGLRRQSRRSDRGTPAPVDGRGPMKIFNEQHEMFRATVRSFVDKEIAPHIEEWEAAGRMPRWIWPRMGELGLLGVEYDEKYGGAGADVLTSAVLHEECARSRSGSFAMAVGVHCDMASPHLYWTGSEALKERYLPAHLPGRGAHRHRGDRARRRQRRGGHPHPGRPRRRSLRHQRLQDVHHQRRHRRRVLRGRAGRGRRHRQAPSRHLDVPGRARRRRASP